MKAIVIDDEQKSREVLIYLLNEYCPSIKIVGSANSALNSIPIIHSFNPDIVFLDMEMPNKNGLELLNYFPSVSFHIIVVSAHSKYSLEAIRSDVSDYLLKPIIPTELVSAVAKVKNSLQKNTIPIFSKKIKIPTITGFDLVDAEEIYYCHADGKYTVFHMVKNKKVISSKNIGFFEKDLKKFGLLRIHRSYIVHLGKIIKYTNGTHPSILLANKIELPISKNRQRELLAHL